MAHALVSKDPASLSYYVLRKAVGIVALSLPFALALGYIVLTPVATGTLPEPRFLESISAYYYTCMGHFFTGALCAIAMFLMCTVGYDGEDEVTGYIASGLALAVAFFPTTPDKPQVTRLEDALGWVHQISAAVLFLVLSYFCFFLFTRTDGNPTPRKLKRNKVYRACGSAIVGSIVSWSFCRFRPSSPSTPSPF